MKDIHEVLRRKQAKYAQLAKQIEALQQAAEKLREVPCNVWGSSALMVLLSILTNPRPRTASAGCFSKAGAL